MAATAAPDVHVQPSHVQPSHAQGIREIFGLMSNEDLAALLGVELSTLAKWRVRKYGPRFTRLGKNVFYRRSDVNDWIATCEEATHQDENLPNANQLELLPT